MSEIKWLQEPEEKDYVAATNYLSLVFPRQIAAKTVGNYLDIPVTHHRANDILRASKLALLPADDPHVQKDLKKIEKGEALSPILMARDAYTLTLLILDGYHRVCACVHYDPNSEVDAKLI